LTRVAFDQPVNNSGQTGFEKRLVELETYRGINESAFKKLQAHSNATVARLVRTEEQIRRADNSLGELRSHIDLVQDCLERQHVLPSWSVHAGLHRQRFNAIRKASGWRGEADLDDVLRQDSATILVFGFAGPAEMVAVRQTTKTSVIGAAGQKVKAQGELQRACAAAENRPLSLTNWALLRESIQMAKDANVDGRQVQAATQFWAQGRARAAVEMSSSREELTAALRTAEQHGISAGDLRNELTEAKMRIAESERMAEAQRKLRIAVSWASSQNLAKLRVAIAEAEEAGVDAQEIAKAEKELSSMLPSGKQESGPPPAAKKQEPSQKKREASQAMAPGLTDLLRAAKPAWTVKDLEAALMKLGFVGIVSIRGLASVLDKDSSSENALNDLLKQAGQKTFTDDTVRSLRSALGTFSKM